MSKWVIIRLAVLMEDEGREQIVAIVDSKSAAQTWIAGQKGQYFGPSDYRFEEVKNGH